MRLRPGGRALRLGQARGPSAAVTCLTFKILLHLRYMYKIDKRGARGFQNRSLGNYQDFSTLIISSYKFILVSTFFL